MEDFKGIRQPILSTKSPHLEEPNFGRNADLGRWVVENKNSISEERAFGTKPGDHAKQGELAGVK